MNCVGSRSISSATPALVAIDPKSRQASMHASAITNLNESSTSSKKVSRMTA